MLAVRIQNPSMKAMHRILFPLVLLFTLGLTSCNFYKEVEVLEVTNIEVKEFNKDVVSADISLKISNPNKYKLKLVDSDIDLFLNGKKMGKMILREPLELPKNDTTIQVLSMKAEVTEFSNDFIANTLSLLFAKTAELKAVGYVKGKAMGIGRKVKVDFTKDIATDSIQF